MPRVMSFNLRVRTPIDLRNPWRRRLPLVVDAIRRFGPDLLGTQECLWDQAEDLLAALPEYAFFGAGRRDGRRRGEMCAVFFKRDAWEQLDGGHFWLSRTPAQPGSRAPGAPFPRMATWVRLRCRRDGFETHWINTHLEAFSRRARAFGADTLRRAILDTARGGPTIVTGDFNAGEGSPPHRTLVDATLQDAYRAANPDRRPDEGTSHFFRGWSRGSRIDWVLASPHFTAREAHIDRAATAGRYPSDHFPVCAVMEYVSGRT